MLTDKWLKSNENKPTDKTKEFADRDGLSVRVSPKGKIVFQLRYRYAGKACRVDLGTYPHMSLKQAREKTQELRKLLDDGKNPKVELLAKKQLYQKAYTVNQLFDEWHTAYCIDHYKNHKQNKARYYKHLAPTIGQLPVERIDLHKWFTILEPIAKNTPATANSLLVLMKAMLRWAAVRGIIKNNVLLNLSSVDFNIKAPIKTRVLSDDELALLSQALIDKIMPPQIKIFFKLCLIYACRGHELRLAKFSDFDFNKGVWTVPVENNKIGKKTNRAIVRPILPVVADLVKVLMAINQRNDQLVASKNGRIYTQNETASFTFQLRKYMALHYGLNDGFSLHDLRRTARTNFSKITTDEVAEVMLGHKIKGIQQYYNHYDYLDEQKKAYQQWIDKLLKIGFVF